MSTSIAAEMAAGEVEEREVTERFSFEIYPSQKRRLRDLQYRYFMSTRQQVSSSRLLREALEEFLAKVEAVLRPQP